MRLSERLKKLEAKAPAEKKIIVVKFGNEIKQLSCGGELFYRLQSESEEEFVERIKRIFLVIPHKQNPIILVGNF